MTSKKLSKPVAADIIYHRAFDSAVQANIITTVSSGKIIIVNSAACKLLGYSKKEILTKSRKDIFNIKESSFKKMLKQRTSEGKSTAVVTAIKKNGRPLACEITSAVFTDEDGNQKAITTISDLKQNILGQNKIDTKKEKIVTVDIVAVQAKSNSRLAENKEWIKNIAKTSYDVMWDWDLVTGNIYVGDSIAEVFGYKVQSNTVKFTDFSQCLSPKEKGRVEKKISKALASGSKSWNDSFILIRQDGSEATTTSRASIVRDENGKAIRLTGAIQDISKLQELEKKLETQSEKLFLSVNLEEELKEEIVIKNEMLTQSNESFKLIFNSSADVLYDSDLVTNDVKISDAYEKEFGYKITGNMMLAEDCISHIHPDDKKAVMENYSRKLASEDNEWKYSFRFLRADNSEANVIVSGFIMRNAGGKAYRMIGSMKDMSKRKVPEERLGIEIELKEQQIAEAMEDAKTAERWEIGKELHDNVNQLLSVSKLYLDMAKEGGEGSELYLSRCSEYTLDAIEEIRKLTKGLTSDIIKNQGLCEAVENIAKDAMEVNPVKISCAMESFREDSVSHKFKLNVYRIVQEQLGNILKHAHAVEVVIKVAQTKKSIVLTISDDGVGFDTGEKRKGIGLANINSRATTYNGTADFVSQPGKGCILTVTFPVAGALSRQSV